MFKGGSIVNFMLFYIKFSGKYLHGIVYKKTLKFLLTSDANTESLIWSNYFVIVFKKLSDKWQF